MGNTKGRDEKNGGSNEAALNVADLIREENSQNQVVIYSKSYCPYCNATKALFTKLQNNDDDDARVQSLQVKVVELDRMKEGPKIQDELHRLTGQSSVPNVFVNNQHVGGNDDTQAAYRNGKLFQLLGWSNNK